MNKALLIIDIQNDYFEGGKMTLNGSEKASLNARKILEKFRSENRIIVHIQHIALLRSSTFFLPESIGAAIHENVKPQENEKIIIKHFPNSFRNTELLDFLHSKDITDLVFCGMMTHMCIDASVRAAKDHGFNCVLIGDACATKELEINGEKVMATEVQKSFLAALNFFYSTVKTTNQFLDDEI